MSTQDAPVSALTWPKVKLGDVSELCLGKMLDAAKNKGEPHFYLRNPDVRWFDIDTSNLRQMPFESHELDRYGLIAGDVVICEGGEAGRAAIWSAQLPNVKFQKAIHRVRTGPRLLNRFLVHRLKYDFDSGRLADYYTGATIKHLTGRDLTRYEFSLPPIPDQHRIVAVLDKAAALSAKRREAIAKLDQLLQSVFLEMFGDPVTNPKGWPIGKVSDLLESVKYGSSEKADLQGEVPILRMNNITYSGEINLADLKYISRDKAEDKYSVVPGDILFNRTNSKELVGKTAVYEGPTPMAYAGYLVRARTTNGHAPEYISAFMNSSYGKSTLQAMCKSIVGMANINAQEFQAISIPIPPCELQQSFRSHVKAIRVRKRALELQSQKFDSLFNSLQQRSFAGAN